MQELPRLSSGHALFLDFDGTLVDIAPRPGEVCVEPGLIATLSRLKSATVNGALAIVTGRTLADIDHYLAPLQLIVASEHGAHFRISTETEEEDDLTAAQSGHMSDAPLKAAALWLSSATASYPQLLLETKTSSLALHYRNAPQLESFCTALMQQLLDTLPDMALLHGKCVVELKPAAASKAQAVGRLMQWGCFRQRMPVFVGDDVTDEHAFIAVQQMGGIGVKVGRGESAARMRCESTAQVRAWLMAQAPISATQLGDEAP